MYASCNLDSRPSRRHASRGWFSSGVNRSVRQVFRDGFEFEVRFTWGTSTSMLIVMRWNFSDVAEVVENTEDDQWLQMRYLVEREAVRATEIGHAAI